MGVIFKGGVVGRISEVGRKSSEVQLLTHPNFRIAARFVGDDRPVTFQGNGILREEKLRFGHGCAARPLRK